MSVRPTVTAKQTATRMPTAGRVVAGRRVAMPAARVLSASTSMAGQRLVAKAAKASVGTRAHTVEVKAAGAKLGRKLKVAVVGGGPAGACAAETLAKGGVETYLIERKMDNCKPCGGAIPLCMINEFDLPEEIVDRKVTKMKMISPSNVSIDVGKTLNDKEYIGMCRREVFDDYLRKRAKANGTKLVNGQMLRMDEPTSPDGTYTVHFSNYDESEDGRTGKPDTIEVDIVIGADGANSRVAKEMGAGEYDYAIAFQERIHRRGQDEEVRGPCGDVR